MQHLIRTLGLAAVGGTLMYSSFATAAEEFAALEGVSAEPMTESEMAEVEGQGFWSIRSRQFSSGGFAYVSVTLNGTTQTSSGTGTQTVTLSSGGVTVTAISNISYSNVTITP